MHPIYCGTIGWMTDVTLLYVFLVCSWQQPVSSSLHISLPASVFMLPASGHPSRWSFVLFACFSFLCGRQVLLCVLIWYSLINWYLVYVCILNLSAFFILLSDERNCGHKHKLFLPSCSLSARENFFYLSGCKDVEWLTSWHYWFF